METEAAIHVTPVILCNKNKSFFIFPTHSVKFIRLYCFDDRSRSSPPTIRSRTAHSLQFFFSNGMSKPTRSPPSRSETPVCEGYLKNARNPCYSDFILIFVQSILPRHMVFFIDTLYTENLNFKFFYKYLGTAYAYIIIKDIVHKILYIIESTASVTISGEFRFDF